MYGIDLNEELSFIGASMRIFKKGEKHVTRHIDCNVLIVMFDGVLKFSENNIEYEVSPGEYFIQKADCFQEGKVESDEPKYFYIHFRGDFKESDGNILNRRGEFDINKLKPLCDLLDKYCHSDYTLSEKLVKFYD